MTLDPTSPRIDSRLLDLCTFVIYERLPCPFAFCPTASLSP
jgi:hypothetical protein